MYLSIKYCKMFLKYFSDLADQFVPSVDVLEDEQQLETSVSSLRSR